jgi:hypothetical protein
VRFLDFFLSPAAFFGAFADCLEGVLAMFAWTVMCSNGFCCHRVLWTTASSCRSKVESLHGPLSEPSHNSTVDYWRGKKVTTFLRTLDFGRTRAELCINVCSFCTGMLGFSNSHKTQSNEPVRTLFSIFYCNHVRKRYVWTLPLFPFIALEPGVHVLLNTAVDHSVILSNS